MKIFVINGKPGSGKDTYVELCRAYVKPGCLLNISTVDCIKTIAKECGWDGEKTPEARAMLSSLKKILTDWNDVPHKDVCRKVALFERELESYGVDADNAVVFIHCREPEEIAKLVKDLHAETILIRRAAVETEQSNSSDSDVEEYDYDYIISNNDTIESLKVWALALMAASGVTVHLDRE